MNAAFHKKGIKMCFRKIHPDEESFLDIWMMLVFLIVGIMTLQWKNLYNFHAFVRSMLE